MSALDRYVLKEIALPFVIGIGLFFVVVAFGQVLKVSDAVTGLGITGGDIMQAFLYSLPPLMGLLIPASALFATLLGVGRMAADREVIGMTAAGVSPYRLLRVPVALGLIFACASAFAMIWGEPWGVRGLRQLMSSAAQRALASGVRTGEFQEWIPDITFFAGSSEAGELRDVIFADRRNPTQPLFIAARTGRVAGGSEAKYLVFELKDGFLLLQDKSKDGYRVVRFDKSRYRLDVGPLVVNKFRTVKKEQQMSMAQLWEEAHSTAPELELDDEDRAVRLIIFYRKIALPLAALIFVLLAVPLACRRTGGARARGFLFSAGIIGGYYYLGRAFELLARNGKFPPSLAAWVPNAVGLLALIVLLIRFRRSAT